MTASAPEIALEGGTDVAEMVLFSTDNLPSGCTDDEALSELVDRNEAIRMPTGADGRYLLHLYLDVEIPEAIRRYCVTDDAKKTTFLAESGRIAFGGAESTFVEFKPNPYVREDTHIAPGRYDAVAYHTEYPDDLVEDAVQDAIGPDGKRVEDIATYIIIGTVAAAITGLILGSVVARPVGFGAAAVTVVVGRLSYKSYVGSDTYKKFDALRTKIQRKFPSIAIQLLRQSG